MDAETKPQISLEELQKKNAELQAQLDQNNETERQITKKMALGLSRPQAIAAIKRQESFPAALKKHDEELREKRKAQKPAQRQR